MASYLLTSHKKGISSRQLARDIEVTKDTAWSMQMRIREAMQDDGRLLCGIVENDFASKGGKKRANQFDGDKS